jgi:penicillin-binding protein 1B
VKFPKLSARVQRVLISVVALTVIALAIWVLYVDHIVTKQFEGRRWTLPAQVYAEPMQLYVGLPLNATSLEGELKRLGYRGVDDPARPGTYRRRGDRIDLTTRKFAFWDGAQDAATISLNADRNSITALHDAAGTDLPITRLDPLLIGSIFPIHGEDRIVVAPDQVPALLPAALKVVEDRRFDTHHGVDIGGILRAVWVDIRAGQFEQGGSTLTQQMVRSYFLDNRRTLGRKVEEALMALLLEVHFDKADLMNAYINEIYLGQDGNRAIHGFGLASEFYFGKPLAELDLHEIALLVAVVRGPSYYDPRRHPDRVRKRRDLVLDLMAEFKVVSPAQAKAAQAKPLGLVEIGRLSGGYYPAFLDLVRRTLRRDYREEDLTEAGLKIFTTLDAAVQTKAERALTAELDRLDKTRKHKESERLQGVVVVTTPQNGEVIAMVGGRDVGFDGFNRALDAKRSIGSLVKPVIYLTALESGKYTPATIVQDEPIEVQLGGNKTWKPQDYSEHPSGPVPLVRALAQSLNLATVHLGMEVGLHPVAEEFHRLGLEEPLAEHPSMLLGAVDVSPLEVAQIYTGLANGGFKTPLRAVRAIVDAKGQPLKSFSLEVTPVADTAAVYELNRMLVAVMEKGTGAPARAYLPPTLTVAGKSGTSSDYRDSWFAGFSGAHVAVVWVGHDDNSPTGLTGSAGALPVWAHLMSDLGTTSWSADMPDSLQEVALDFDTGLRIGQECPGANVVGVAVPKDAQLEVRADCAGDSSTSTSWWRRIFGSK